MRRLWFLLLQTLYFIIHSWTLRSFPLYVLSLLYFTLLYFTVVIELLNGVCTIKTVALKRQLQIKMVTKHESWSTVNSQIMVLLDSIRVATAMPTKLDHFLFFSREFCSIKTFRFSFTIHLINMCLYKPEVGNSTFPYCRKVCKHGMSFNFEH